MAMENPRYSFPVNTFKRNKPKAANLKFLGSFQEYDGYSYDDPDEIRLGKAYIPCLAMVYEDKYKNILWMYLNVIEIEKYCSQYKDTETVAWEHFFKALQNSPPTIGSNCTKCKHEVKERVLFNSRFIGCMC
jgi:hypothetical protein